jgi:hypothetical protein
MAAIVNLLPENRAEMNPLASHKTGASVLHLALLMSLPEYVCNLFREVNGKSVCAIYLKTPSECFISIRQIRHVKTKQNRKHNTIFPVLLIEYMLMVG